MKKQYITEERSSMVTPIGRISSDGKNIGPWDPTTKKWSVNDRMMIPVTMIPRIRTGMAQERGALHNLLLTTWGGLGDQICAEPTIRYIVEKFPEFQVSLASERPELFRHLQFKRVFDLRQERPVEEKYLLIETNVPSEATSFFQQYVNHAVTHAVDYSSLVALGCQLPVAEKEIQLVPIVDEARTRELFTFLSKPFVVVHAGKHWASKTFPKDWWDAVLANLLRLNVTPVLIGADTDDNRTTVAVDTTGCVDMRNKLSVIESVWLLQQSRVLLTNDSAPLHMAASGGAWIGFVATCKHPDHILHWRQGQWGWRMKNFGRGGIWDEVKRVPASEHSLTIEFVEEDLLRSWLPEPQEFAGWAAERALE